MDAETRSQADIDREVELELQGYEEYLRNARIRERLVPRSAYLGWAFARITKPVEVSVGSVMRARRGA